ncbi:Uncharacterised protein [Mycobacteroides abscessus subsp. massiliense]|nr:hypothetical protein [Mycobacteroides abscessus]SKM19946.1 Uncharacterised protein [Mycobacteroides abscessus subsp. massiliense]MDM2426851.1 hypothetical protein [Mycobacteroides abscessus]MDM2431819.1 hypothetical protein [Mycobacteroides abscessus]MDM2436569.1 hypothetical protein [Mycobacteroides abscessus]
MTQQYRITLTMADGFTNEEVGEDLSRLISNANELAKEHGGSVAHDYVDKAGLIAYTDDDNDKAAGRAQVTPVF